MCDYENKEDERVVYLSNSTVQPKDKTIQQSNPLSEEGKTETFLFGRFCFFFL